MKPLFSHFLPQSPQRSGPLCPLNLPYQVPGWLTPVSRAGWRSFASGSWSKCFAAHLFLQKSASWWASWNYLFPLLTSPVRWPHAQGIWCVTESMIRTGISFRPGRERARKGAVHPSGPTWARLDVLGRVCMPWVSWDRAQGVFCDHGPQGSPAGSAQSTWLVRALVFVLPLGVAKVHWASTQCQAPALC